MAFKLPNYEDLTPEQTQIVSLPSNQNFVIQGGPGTGKTVMAIYRAGMMPKNARVLVLVYNRPLCDFIKTSMDKEYYGQVEVNTISSWLGKFFGGTLHEAVPMNSPTPFDCDWEAIKERLTEIGNAAKAKSKAYYHHIIVDESQDCHPALLCGLAAISQNITCFIDPNQKVVAGKNTGLEETLSALCQLAPVSLTRNFRNTKPIRDASVLFWTGKPGEPPPAEAEFDGNKPRMIQCAIRPSKKYPYDLDDQMKKMTAVILNNLQKEIGVLVNANSLNQTKESLKKSLGDAVSVQMYKTKTDEKIDFNVSGVKILSHGTMKGLEFDLLLIPGLDYANKAEMKKALDSEEDDAVPVARAICKNRLYVGFSRPLQELCIFYFNDIASMPKWQRPIVKPIFDHPELFDWEKNASSATVGAQTLLDFLD